MLDAATNPPQYWFVNTGATNHMINEIQMLNNIAPYPANDIVQVGKGKHLHITQIRNAMLGFLDCKMFFLYMN